MKISALRMTLLQIKLSLLQNQAITFLITVTLQEKSLQYKGRIEKTEQIIKIDQIARFLNEKIPTLEP